MGSGPDGGAVALWSHAAGFGVRLVTRIDPDGRGTGALQLRSPRAAQYVQPLPDGQVLLVDSRSIGRAGSAEVRDADGRWVRSAHLGDGVAHVLATSSGDVWLGYFDKAAAFFKGIGGRGLVRLGPDLQPVWRYPFSTGAPRIHDCYTLNVADERAPVCAYQRFRIISAQGDSWTDHGEAPHRGAEGLLVEGDRAVLVGGYGAEYDLLTPLRLDDDGVHVDGPLARLVMPDGMELYRPRYTCRGPLHAVVDRPWLRLDLEDVFHAH